MEICPTQTWEQLGNKCARTPAKTGNQGRPATKTSQQVRQSGPVGGESQFVLQTRAKSTRVPGFHRIRVPAEASLTHCASEAGTRWTQFGISKGMPSRRPSVTPLSVSDTAHDGAPASDTN